MMMSYAHYLEKDFIENGGIHERMTAVRLRYRNIQYATIEAKDREVVTLKAEIENLKKEIECLKKRKR